MAKCPNCGAEVADGVQYCPHCGFAIGGVVESPGEAQKPPVHGQYTSKAEDAFPYTWTGGEYASTMARGVAWFIIDLPIMTILGGMAFLVLWLAPTLLFGALSRGNEAATGLGGLLGFLLGLVGVFLIFWFYDVVPTAKTGQTLGKKLMGVKVVTSKGELPGVGRTVMRELVGKLFSSLFLSFGFWWAAFDTQRRAWHDMLAGTVVVPAGKGGEA